MLFLPRLLRFNHRSSQPRRFLKVRLQPGDKVANILDPEHQELLPFLVHVDL